MWFSKWMDVYKADIVRENTKRHYTHIYKAHISPSLGMLPLSQISKLQIQNLINGLKRKGFQWETQNKVRILLNDMFDRALEDDFVRRNPAKGVHTASNRPKKENRVLTVNEQAVFLNVRQERFIIIFL